MDCPGVGFVGLNLRVQCEDGSDNIGGGGTGDSDGPTTIGTMEPVLLDPIYVEAEEFERKIDTDSLNECIEKALQEFLLQPNSTGWLVAKFAGETPGYNWILKTTGSFEDGQIAVTPEAYDRSRNAVTTRINTAQFTQATDIEVLKSILHEVVHAYLLTYNIYDPNGFVEDYIGMLARFGKNKAEQQHEEFANSFIQDIATALEDYGKAKGYTMDRQYYEDISWAGLYGTDAFKAKPQSERIRIANRISVEQS